MPTPASFGPRYRLLDAWRGFACLIVVLHHAGFVLLRPSASGAKSWPVALQNAAYDFYRRLDLGVPLFFVISGYCIAASMDAHRARGASPWRFLGRRAWRIYPPYWAAVAIFALTVAALHAADWRPIREGVHSLHLDAPGALSWSQWLGNLSLTETWRRRAFGGDSYRNFTRISWTLCFEEQFYLVGFVALLLSPRRLFGALAAASALILAVAAAAFDAGWFNRLEGTFPELWYQFAVGLAVYWRLVRAGSDRARRLVDLGLAGLAGAGLWNGSPAMAAVGLFGLALIGLRRRDDRLSAAAALAPLRACGHRCYSIYLIHLPVCTVGTEALVQLGATGFWTQALAVAPAVAAAGVAAGWAFFAVVERRFHNPSPASPSRRPSDAIEAADPRLDPVAAA